MTIKVRANSVGFFDNTLRKVGDEFEIADASQMGRWMDIVEDVPEKKRRGRPPKDRSSEEAPASEDN